MDQTDWLLVAFLVAAAIAMAAALVHDERRRQGNALQLDALLSQRARLEAEARGIEVLRRQQHEELVALEHKRLDIRRRERYLEDSFAAEAFGLPTQPDGAPTSPPSPQPPQPRPASLSQPMGLIPPLGPASPSRPLFYCPDCWQLLRQRYPRGYKMQPQGEAKFCRDHLIGRIREQDFYDFSWEHVGDGRSVPIVPVAGAGDGDDDEAEVEPMRALSQQSGVTMLSSIEAWLHAQQQEQQSQEKEGQDDAS